MLKPWNHETITLCGIKYNVRVNILGKIPYFIPNQIQKNLIFTLFFLNICFKKSLIGLLYCQVIRNLWAIFHYFILPYFALIYFRAPSNQTTWIWDVQEMFNVRVKIVLAPLLEFEQKSIRAKKHGCKILFQKAWTIDSFDKSIINWCSQSVCEHPRKQYIWEKLVIEIFGVNLVKISQNKTVWTYRLRKLVL